MRLRDFSAGLNMVYEALRPTHAEYQCPGCDYTCPDPFKYLSHSYKPTAGPWEDYIQCPECNSRPSERGDWHEIRVPDEGTIQ